MFRKRKSTERMTLYSVSRACKESIHLNALTFGNGEKYLQGGQILQHLTASKSNKDDMGFHRKVGCLNLIQKQTGRYPIHFNFIHLVLKSQRVNHMWYQRVLLQGNWWSQYLIHWCHLVMVAPLLANWAKLKLVVGLWEGEGGALLGWVRGGSACSASALNKLHSTCSPDNSWLLFEQWVPVCSRRSQGAHHAGLEEKTN